MGTTSELSKDISGHRNQSGFNASVDRAVIFESFGTELVCLAELVPVTDVEEATTHCAEMMVAAVNTAHEFRASAPKMLWEGNYSSGAGSSCGMPGVASSNYDVTADGQHFLMVRDDDAADVGKSIVVVLNWAEELRSRTSTATR